MLTSFRYEDLPEKPSDGSFSRWMCKISDLNDRHEGQRSFRSFRFKLGKNEDKTNSTELMFLYNIAQHKP